MPELQHPSSSFAIGDKVVLQAVAVMTITGIGTRRSLTPPDMENVTLDVAGALQGSSVLQTVSADDESVYALRFIGESRDSMLLAVAAAEKEGLRRVSTRSEIDAFLRAVADTARAKSGGSHPPEDLARSTMRARNDLQTLARLYPRLAEKPGSEWYSVERDQRKQLRAFFIDELSSVRGIGPSEAEAALDRAERGEQ